MGLIPVLIGFTTKRGCWPDNKRLGKSGSIASDRAIPKIHRAAGNRLAHAFRRPEPAGEHQRRLHCLPRLLRKFKKIGLTTPVESFTGTFFTPTMAGAS